MPRPRGGDRCAAMHKSLRERPAISTRLDASVRAILGMIAALQGRSVNSLIEEAVDHWLRQYAERKPPQC